MRTPDPQTQPENFRYLAASERLLSHVAFWRFVQLIVVVILPTILAVYGATQGKPNFIIPFIGFVSALLDASLFNAMILNNRYRAAQLSDEYDARIISTTSSVVRQEAVPALEVVLAHAKRRMLRSDAAALTAAYYSKRLIELTPPAASLLCQRISSGRDESLRSSYISWLLGASGCGLFVLVVVWGVAGWDLQSLVTNVLLPIVPTVAWLSREVIDHLHVRALRDRLRSVIERQGGLWSNLMAVPHDPASLAGELESVRGMQFMLRAMEPSLPGWLRNHDRQSRVDILAEIADVYVNDAIASGFGSRAARRTGRAGTRER